MLAVTDYLLAMMLSAQAYPPQAFYAFNRASQRKSKQVGHIALQQAGAQMRQPRYYYGYRQRAASDVPACLVSQVRGQPDKRRASFF